MWAVIAMSSVFVHAAIVERRLEFLTGIHPSSLASAHDERG